MLLVGDQEQHTTVAESQRMRQAVSGPAELVTFPGAGHVDLYDFDTELYQEQVGAFLKQHLPVEPVAASR